jgi:hypothetical protein
MKKIIVSLFLVLLFISAIIANPALAQTEACPAGSPAGSTCLSNPLSVNSPQALIGNIINSILGVVGSIALIMFIYGGFTWLTSGGSAENVKKGKDIIIWATIGLAVIFLSYGLVKYLLLNIK